MTQEQYDLIAYSCENGDLSLFNKLPEAEKDKLSCDEWDIRKELQIFIDENNDLMKDF